MQTDGKQLLKTLRPSRILLPIIIGFSVGAFLLIRNFDRAAFDAVRWSWNSTVWLAMAFVAVIIRDWAYMVRIRALSDMELSWWRSFVVIMLWEFCSAIVPGMLGGGFLFAIFILNREGINMGRSITAITLSSFQDGVFLVIMAPLVLLLIGPENLFSTLNPESINSVIFGKSFLFYFWSVYFIIFAYKLFVAYALFINPRFIKFLLLKTFSLPLLNRWRYPALETGNQLLIASTGLKNKNRKFWIHSFAGTFFSWTARYVTVNFLIMAVHDVPVDHLVLYGRQVVMGIIILFSPTPGGSGLAEFIFSEYLREFIPYGLSPSLGLLWRLITYYPYIIIGVILLPRWIRKHFSKDELKAAAKA